MWAQAATLAQMGDTPKIRSGLDCVIDPNERESIAMNVFASLIISKKYSGAFPQIGNQVQIP